MNKVILYLNCYKPFVHVFLPIFIGAGGEVELKPEN